MDLIIFLWIFYLHHYAHRHAYAYDGAYRHAYVHDAYDRDHDHDHVYDRVSDYDLVYGRAYVFYVCDYVGYTIFDHVLHYDQKPFLRVDCHRQYRSPLLIFRVVLK